MPRTKRIKDNEAIYHVIVRGNSDMYLFPHNKDKEKFLFLIKKYQIQHSFKVYAYCLMTTHAHFIIDSNGSDISKFMHGINQSYAQYYNRKYNRTGHVFMDRFKSIIINNTRYLLIASAYIHNNPIDIKKYKSCIEKYKFSSLAIYLGLKKDPFGILHEDYIMQLFSNNVKEARKSYLNLVYIIDKEKLKKSTKFKDNKTEYRSERTILIRNYSPEEILKFISKYTKTNKWNILLKYNKEFTQSKALFVFLLRCLCNLRHKDICKFIGDITQSRVSKLCNIGTDLVMKNNCYKNIISDFLHFHKLQTLQLNF